jgi:4-hydroxybenzoate polyprenyltransferase
MVGLFQVLFLMTLFTAGLMAERGPYYYAGLMVAAALALYQQRLIATRDPAKCFAAFLNNSWLGAVVFLGIALDYLLSP